MSLDSLLMELVSRVEGATGAIIVGVDGEAVATYSITNSIERLRLRGAYVALILQAFRGSPSRATLGNMNGLVLEYDGANLLAQEIDDDCLIVLELEPPGHIGQAQYRLEVLRERLRAELTS